VQGPAEKLLEGRITSQRNRVVEHAGDFGFISQIPSAEIIGQQRDLVLTL
jgi:hypothetical protein